MTSTLSMDFQLNVIAFYRVYLLHRFTFKNDEIAIKYAELDLLEFDLDLFFKQSFALYRDLPIVQDYLKAIHCCFSQLFKLRQIGGDFHLINTKAFLVYIRGVIHEMGKDNTGFTYQPFEPPVKSLPVKLKRVIYER